MTEYEAAKDEVRILSNKISDLHDAGKAIPDDLIQQMATSLHQVDGHIHARGLAHYRGQAFDHDRNEAIAAIGRMSQRTAEMMRNPKEFPGIRAAVHSVHPF